MGGRGTFAVGNSVAYTYETVGFIEGVKVLQGLPGYKGLPVESHSSIAYVQLHPDGIFKMYREYDRDRFLIKEIAYHREYQLSGNNDPIIHIHEYSRDFKHRITRLLTAQEYEKYKKFFVGVK